MRIRFVLGICVLSAAPACVPRERPGGSTKQSGAGAPASMDAPSETEAPEDTESSGAPKEEEEIPTPRPDDALLVAPWEDAFERQALGPDWRTTSGSWQLQDGKLCGRGARNHPVWLAKRLPVNARIEFDAVSFSPDGDIKAEYWGDGRSAAAGVSYNDATSYLSVFGGWKNHYHVLARLDEHAKTRKELRVDPQADDLRARRVEPHVSYRFKVERKDARAVTWFINDVEMLTYEDDAPLRGPGHEYFGYNNWDVRVCFDNLKITPLPDT